MLTMDAPPRANDARAHSTGCGTAAADAPPAGVA